MDTVDRMFELVDVMYKEQKDFAAALDTHPTRISTWRKRKSSSYQKYLPEIAEVLNTTVAYLITGEGPKEKGAARITGGSNELTRAEYEIILAYRRADARTRSMVDLALEPFKVPSQSAEAI